MAIEQGWENVQKLVDTELVTALETLHEEGIFFLDLSESRKTEFVSKLCDKAKRHWTNLDKKGNIWQNNI